MCSLRVVCFVVLKHLYESLCVICRCLSLFFKHLYEIVCVSSSVKHYYESCVCLVVC